MTRLFISALLAAGPMEGVLAAVVDAFCLTDLMFRLNATLLALARTTATAQTAAGRRGERRRAAREGGAARHGLASLHAAAEGASCWCLRISHLRTGSCGTGRSRTRRTSSLGCR